MATARLEARISVELHASLKRAAEIEGRTVCHLGCTGCRIRASEQSSVTRLSLADQECFAAALLAPPKPAAALKRAFARRKKLLCA